MSFWIVRIWGFPGSGVSEDSKGSLPLFHKIALYIYLSEFPLILPNSSSSCGPSIQTSYGAMLMQTTTRPHLDFSSTCCVFCEYSPLSLPLLLLYLFLRAWLALLLLHTAAHISLLSKGENTFHVGSHVLSHHSSLLSTPAFLSPMSLTSNCVDLEFSFPRSTC